MTANPANNKNNGAFHERFSAYVIPLICLVFGLLGGWFLLTIFYVFFTPLAAAWPNTVKGKILIVLYYVAWYALTLFVFYQWFQFAVATEYPGLIYPSWLPHFLF